jgi:FkbM family methyltransferase
MWALRLLRAAIGRIPGGKQNRWVSGMLFDLLERSYRVSGMQFEIPKGLTTRSFRARFLWDQYEIAERYLVDRYVQENDRILDLGGCLGVVSCLANRKLGDPRKHVVVEANPALIPWLTLNRDKNGCGFAIRQGVLSRSSDGTFFIHRDIVDGSAELPGERRISVPVMTVEQIESKYGLHFNAIIMDIEGGEVAFLQENPGLLSQAELVIVEFHGAEIGADASERGRAILRNLGFTNVETVGNTDAWIRNVHVRRCAGQPIQVPATMEDLPNIASSQDYAEAWDGVDGVYVQELPAAVCEGRPRAVKLIEAPIGGCHRLGIRFRPAAGPGTYRVTALVKPEGAARAYMEVRYGTAANRGLAFYDLRAPAVLRTTGALRDAGIAPREDGWLAAWIELDYCDGTGVVYVGLLTRGDVASYQGDGKSALAIRFAIEPSGSRSPFAPEMP